VAQSSKTLPQCLAPFTAYLPLEPCGDRWWVAVCPFHPQRRPALILDPRQKSFFCWSCRLQGRLQRLLELLVLHRSGALQKLYLCANPRCGEPFKVTLNTAHHRYCSRSCFSDHHTQVPVSSPPIASSVTTRLICANPECGQEFTVLTRNTRKKYCTEACAEQVSAGRRRAKRAVQVA
jgi:hypothetical protein